MRKILIVTSGFPLWETEGLNVFMLDFAKMLAKDNEVFVLAPLSGSSKKFEAIGNIKVYRHMQFPFFNANLAYGSGIMGNIKKNPLLLFVVPFFFLLQLLAVRKIVKNHSIAIINAHWIIPQGVVAGLYKKIFNRKVKIISTVHGSDYNSLDSFIGNMFKKFALKNSKKITTVSQFLFDALVEAGYQNVHLCPLGVDSIRFSPDKADLELRRSLKAENGFLLYVGALIEGKGVRYLLSSMIELAKEFKDVRLIMVGEGYLLPELQLFCAQNGIEKNVIFSKVIPNEKLPPYFATADVFILPSFSEGFPVVIKEALSSGVICVVTDLPAFNSVPILNEVLLKVKVADAGDIAKKIRYVLNNKSSLDDLRKKGRGFILENSDWEVVRKKFSNLTENL